jgi:tetratricopeptide (TPR) repeat protein
MTLTGDDATLRQAIALHQSGRFAEAETLYRQILVRVPDHADALHFLGVLAGQFNRHEAAVELIRKALSIRPDDVEARFNLATNLIPLGKIEEAIAEFNRVLEVQKDDPDAHLLIADLLRQVSRKDEAVTHLRRTIALREQNPDAYNNLGNLLQERGEVDEAILCFQRSLALRPGNAQTLNNLGNARRQKGEYDAALGLLRQAVAAQPDSPQMRTNLGNVLCDVGEVESAITEFRAALKDAPTYADAWNHLGIALRSVGEVEEALAAHRQALSLRPDFDAARYAEAWALLLLGRFDEGWRAYEARPRAASGWGRFPNSWKGEPLNGRRILLHAEQGFGDTIQFGRFASIVAELGGHVILECQQELISLLPGLAGIKDLVARDDPLPPFDVHCPLMSIPLVLGTTETTIPSRFPYISPDPNLVAEWANRLKRHGPRPHVGLVWTGRATSSEERRRSMRLKDFGPLAGLKGLTFHSLQVGPAGDQVNEPGVPRLIDHRSELHDFSDTAALIANLDLVITVDTAVAHLAGAMGKDVWTMLQLAPDWRWMLDREDSPWYPTMRLFRQRQRAHWGDVVTRVTGELSRRYADPLRASATSTSPA